MSTESTKKRKVKVGDWLVSWSGPLPPPSWLVAEFCMTEKRALRVLYEVDKRREQLKDQGIDPTTLNPWQTRNEETK